jgi:hypothetical protein
MALEEDVADDRGFGVMHAVGRVNGWPARPALQSGNVA